MFGTGEAGSIPLRGRDHDQALNDFPRYRLVGKETDAAAPARQLIFLLQYRQGLPRRNRLSFVWDVCRHHMREPLQGSRFRRCTDISSTRVGPAIFQ